MSIAALNVPLDNRSYDVIVSNDGFTQWQDVPLATEQFANRSCFVITDKIVQNLYLESVKQFLINLGVRYLGDYAFSPGEKSKNLETVEAMYSQMIAAGLDRKSMVIALGGGVVGDTAGFAAATYMRGVDYIQIPTSLVAQVDSSVGGKTGVDLEQGKNLIGAFHQPKMVFVDTMVLKSLPVRELACGLAEVVKYGVILDENFFMFLEENVSSILQIDQTVFQTIVHTCCSLKAGVVASDEFDHGRRAILNYGHTFGHALEKLTAYTDLTHGEAIAIGMGMAADLAVMKYGGSQRLGLVKRQDDLFQSLGLPIKFNRFTPDEILLAMYTDKKCIDGELNLVLPEKIGKVNIDSKIEKNLIKRAIGARLD